MTQSVIDSEYIDVNVDVMEYNHVDLVQHVLKSTQSDLLRWSQMRSEFQNTFRFEFIPNKAKQKRGYKYPLSR